MNRALFPDGALPRADESSWETPDELFSQVDREFGPLEIDVAAAPGNAKCERFFTRERSGLEQLWVGRVWMNPPYGMGVEAWLDKATEELRDWNCELVVALLPVRADSAWFHRCLIDNPWCHEIRFFLGRVRFKTGHRPRFGSLLAILRNHRRPGGVHVSSIDIPQSCKSGRATRC